MRGAILKAFIQAIESAGATIATKGARLSKRLGFGDKPVNIKTLTAAVKENPVTAGLVAFELFGPASEFAQEAARTTPALAEVFANLTFESDTVEADDSIADISKFDDEFDIIRVASREVGGLAALLNLRNALMLDDNVYALFVKVKELAD